MVIIDHQVGILLFFPLHVLLKLAFTLKGKTVAKFFFSADWCLAKKKIIG
jgi:hypothetical protein